MNSGDLSHGGAAPDRAPDAGGPDESASAPAPAPGQSSLAGALGRPWPGPAPAPGKRALTDGLAADRLAGPAEVPPAAAAAIARAEGEPLPDAEAWSRRIGADVRHARIVTGEGAPEAAREMGARAFTVGHRVFFGAGYDAATDGGALLAQELPHVVQQRGAPAPAAPERLPVVAYGDAREREARAGAAPTPGSSELALARDAEADLAAGPYRAAFAQQIGEGIVAYLAAHDLPTGSRFVAFPGPLLAGPAIVGATGKDLEAKLDGWLGKAAVDRLVDRARPMGREQVTDGDQTWIEDKAGAGPSRWFPDVAVALGGALAAKLRQSLDRIVPRYQRAAVAIGVAEEEQAQQSLTAVTKPTASDIVASQPIDEATIAALLAHATFDFAGYRAAHPNEKGKLGAVRPLTQVKWTVPKPGTYFARVEPADATVEEVAAGLFGSTLKSSEIAVAAPPLFGLASATLLTSAHQAALTALGADLHASGDVLGEATTGALADELAKLQGGATPGKAATKGAVLRTLDESAAIVQTIERAGAAFGMGKNPTVASMEALTKRLADRRGKIAAASEEDALQWAGQTEAQQQLLTQIAFGFDREARRLAELTKLVTDATVKLGGLSLPPHVREAMNHVAMGYADCALVSDLPATAAPKLAAVEDEAGALPITFLEGTLASVQRTLDDAREAKRDAGEHAAYDVPGLAAREQQLKARLTALRARIKTDPEGATQELKELARLVSELQTETELVANMDQIDAAWTALDASVSWLWSSLKTHAKVRVLQAQGDALHARWKAIFAAWRSGEPARQAEAKRDYEALRAGGELAAWLGQVQAVAKSAQIEKLIGQLVALVAITVVTMGVGDLVVAGAAGWELSAGSTALLAGGAEAATFTLLSQVFLDSDHSFGHVVYEFGANWAIFGVMRRFQLFAEVAALGKASAVGGNVLILAATTYAKADLDKYLKEGRHLTEAEVKQIALQGMAMAIAMHAIAPQVKPMFAELEGSAYAFATRLKANNRTQETLAASAEALRGTRDFTKAQELVGKEKAWLEERLKILDEVEAAARKESEGGKPPADGIAAKLKLSPEALSSLRVELQGHLATLKDSTLPLMSLEPKGPGLYTCPRESIREVVAALGEVQRTTVDPQTTIVTYEVKLPDQTIVKVMEKIDPAADWVAHLKTRLGPEGLARLEVELQGKTPQQIMDHFHGNVDVAVERLATPGGDSPKTAQDTVDMFGVAPIPKEPNERWTWKNKPDNWSGERRLLHDALIAKAKAQAQRFADAAQSGEPTLYAMRGNTAAGKTRAVSMGVPELAGPMAQTKELPHRSVNPDNFKADLIEASGGTLTSTQVHWESSMLAERLEGELLGMKTSDGTELGSILIDKRLASAGDVAHYARLAKDSGRRFVLYDVDAPLEVSLAGVLERTPGGADPLPPFEVVASGFNSVRDNRQAVVDMFLADPAFGTYEVYGTRPSGERAPAAAVRDGVLEIKDPALYREVMAGPGDAAEILATQRITEPRIEALIGALDGDRGTKVGNLLRRYLGFTWKAALDAHSAEKPLLQPPKKGPP